jgi:hypothetical protein
MEVDVVNINIMEGLFWLILDTANYAKEMLNPRRNLIGLYLYLCAEYSIYHFIG